MGMKTRMILDTLVATALVAVLVLAIARAMPLFDDFGGRWGYGGWGRGNAAGPGATPETTVTRRSPTDRR